jgi:hypothetical protein
MIANAWQIAHSAAADHHRAVFLQVMIDTGNICGNFFAIGQTHTGDFPKRRIGLLWRLRSHDQTHTSFLRTSADIGTSLFTL